MVQEFKGLNTSVEDTQDGVNALKIVLFEGLELFLSLEESNELLESSLEEVEAAKDLLGIEVELSSLRHAFKTLLGELILRKVSLMELQALVKDSDQFVSGYNVLIPKDAIITSLRCGLLGLGGGRFSSRTLFEIQNVVLAVGDHLVGDLHEETGHTFVSVVVSGDSVDHLNGVHQNGEGLNNGQWSSIVERLDVSFESEEVLDVVLGLIELLGNSELNGAPV